MEPPSSDERRMAPSAAPSGSALRLPGDGSVLPPPYIDERLVRPETREEMVRGQLIYAAPAKPEHGDRHAKVESVIDAHVAPGYISSVDLLTRAGPRSDFATDTCVRRDGIDPRTGSRYLEELAFEIVNEQSMRHMTVRAEDLTACGVRRLIGVFVKKGEVRQWSGELRRWVQLDLDDVIDDPTLTRPVPVRALLDATAAADAVVGAFEAKGHPRFEQLRDQGRTEGLLKAIDAVAELLGLPLGTNRRAHLESLDPQQLEAWLERMKAERRWPGES